MRVIALEIALTLPSPKMGEGEPFDYRFFKICCVRFKQSPTLGLRLPAMHRNIDRLPGRIVNPHFSETTIPGLLRCVALGARCTGGL